MNRLVINNEECRQIRNYERYVISESGRIYRVVPLTIKERKLQVQYYHEVTPTPSNVKDQLSLIAILTIENKKRLCINVTRIVAETFLSEPTPKRHNCKLIYIDDNPLNTHYSNLKYSQVFSNAKITKIQVKEIKHLLEENKLNLREIAKLYGVSDMQINRIKTGECWNKGKRVIEKPKAPFEIEDPKIRRFVATFDNVFLDSRIKKKFYIKRTNDPIDNQIIGVVNGIKLSKKHQNITRAIQLVEKLNQYFFTEQKPEKTLAYGQF